MRWRAWLVWVPWCSCVVSLASVASALCALHGCVGRFLRVVPIVPVVGGRVRVVCVIERTRMRIGSLADADPMSPGAGGILALIAGKRAGAIRRRSIAGARCDARSGRQSNQAEKTSCAVRE